MIAKHLSAYGSANSRVVERHTTSAKIVADFICEKRDPGSPDQGAKFLKKPGYESEKCLPAVIDCEFYK